MFLFSETIAFGHESTRSLSVFDEIFNGLIFNVLGIIIENKFTSCLFGSLGSTFTKGDCILRSSGGFLESRYFNIEVKDCLLAIRLLESHFGDSKLLNFRFVESFVFSQVILARSWS